MHYRDWESPNGFIVRSFHCCDLEWQLIIRPMWIAAENWKSKRCSECGAECTVPPEKEPPHDRHFVF